MDRIEVPAGKYILDVTCGGRMMWFDKAHENVLYTDKRTETHELCDGRIYEVAPDIQCDFTDLPFADKTFKHVVFDPPHLEKLGESSFMAKKYGILGLNWRETIRRGLLEGMRVLDDYGTLTFKWNQTQVKIKDVEPLFPCPPLYGHPTSRNGLTICVTFMKIPNQ